MADADAVADAVADVDAAAGEAADVAAVAGEAAADAVAHGVDTKKGLVRLTVGQVKWFCLVRNCASASSCTRKCARGAPA